VLSVVRQRLLHVTGAELVSRCCRVEMCGLLRKHGTDAYICVGRVEPLKVRPMPDAHAVEVRR